MSNPNLIKKSFPSKKKKPVAKISNTYYSPRKNDQYEAIVSSGDNRRLITGTSTAVPPPEANGESSLLVHQGKHALGVDLESNFNDHYGSISNSAHEIRNDGYCYIFQNSTSTQLWLLVAILALLVILTGFLYLLGDTDQLKIIWNKIFCWLGVTECKKSAVKKLT